MAISLLIATTALLSIPAASSASFHEILVREVYAGGASNDSYVVLQAYNPGQNFVATHSVTAYNATGGPIGTFTFTDKVNNGQDQMTILVADTAYSSTFPGPTYPNPPDGVMANLDLTPTGGAVCWAGLDCVSWGNFSGSTSPTSGTPAFSPGGIPASMGLHRNTTGGSCTNQLDPADDTNDSASDFISQTPHPRNNASPIEEGASCTPPVAPDTTISSATPPPSPARTNSTEATFTFTASPPDEATFECKLDNELNFTACTSPESYSSLTSGAEASHIFRVRAVHPTNGKDTTPATHTWIVDTVAPTVTIDTKPKNPSPGNSVTFTFHPSESVSKLECSLDEGVVIGAFADCSSPKSYTSLSDGTYTFNVKATADQAGNPGLPTSHTWVVNNSLNDETPPLTTITSTPPNPSTSSTASFTYVSSEEDSTFECALDGGAFVSCSAAGVAYTGLANGPHSFQVRATDSFGNTDKSPAGYSWDVVVLPVIVVPPIVPTPLAPQTTITGKPGATTRDRTPTFRFKSSVAGSNFQCKLDKGALRPCTSPLTTKPLPFGSHTMQVQARATGLTDPTPAKASFRIVKPRKKPRR